MMRTKGFTLIELLAVVLVIAVMMGIGFPQYRKAVDKARVTEAEAMLRTIYDSSERLAGNFGYRSYLELVADKGSTNYSWARFDMFDANRLPKGCTISSGKLDCSRFIYNPLIQGSDGNYYVAAKLKTGRYKGTYVMMSRDSQELYCQPKSSSDTGFCDILGLDSLNIGFSF